MKHMGYGTLVGCFRWKLETTSQFASECSVEELFQEKVMLPAKYHTHMTAEFMKTETQLRFTGCLAAWTTKIRFRKNKRSKRRNGSHNVVRRPNHKCSFSDCLCNTESCSLFSAVPSKRVFSPAFFTCAKSCRLQEYNAEAH